MILLLLAVIYIIGFIITILHETAHIVALGETPQQVVIGVPILLKIEYRNINFYPIFPFAGRTWMNLTRQPTKLRMLIFTISGVVAGVVASIICGFSGYMLMPVDILSRFHRNGHHLGFLLRDIITGSSDFQTTFATALIMSAIIYGVQELGNLAPIRYWDGHNFLRVLFFKAEE